jgi:hypothetical protein
MRNFFLRALAEYRMMEDTHNEDMGKLRVTDMDVIIRNHEKKWLEHSERMSEN